MIAFIDCFINDPVNEFVNQFTLKSQQPCTYHMPTIQGFDGLYSIEEKISKIVILGSASHVHENLPWHKELLDFIIPKLEKGIPVLGLCFDHQLLAHYFGAKVDYIPNRNKELPPLKEDRELVFNESFLGKNKGDRICLAYAHSQIILEMPDDLISFLSSDFNSYEGIYHKELPFIGLQAHPEASKNFLINDCNVDSEVKIDQILTDGFDILNAFTSN